MNSFDSPGDRACLVVEDEPLVAEDIADVLRENGFGPIHVAYSAAAGRTYLRQHDVVLAVLDVHLGAGETGIELASWISERRPIPFIFLTAFSDVATVRAAATTLPAAYLVKPFKPDDLIANVELALIKQYNRAARSPDWNAIAALPATPLTGREVDMLRMLAAGKSNREIAAASFVSVNTVKTHLSNLYTKIGVSSRVAALAWLNRIG